jgi:hypothetical protein
LEKASSSLSGRSPIRSLIYVHRDIYAHLVQIDSPDLTAAQVNVTDRSILTISAYVPPVDENALTRAIEQIRNTVRVYSPGHELIIAGALNQHDQLWGGDQVGTTTRQGEATHFIELMMHEIRDDELDRYAVHLAAAVKRAIKTPTLRRSHPRIPKGWLTLDFTYLRNEYTQ